GWGFPDGLFCRSFSVLDALSPQLWHPGLWRILKTGLKRFWSHHLCPAAQDFRFMFYFRPCFLEKMPCWYAIPCICWEFWWPLPQLSFYPELTAARYPILF